MEAGRPRKPLGWSNQNVLNSKKSIKEIKACTPQKECGFPQAKTTAESQIILFAMSFCLGVFKRTPLPVFSVFPDASPIPQPPKMPAPEIGSHSNADHKPCDNGQRDPRR